MIYYNCMKDKYQKRYNNMAHWFNLFNVLQAMFEWDGLPDTIMQEQLESILISNGNVGIGELQGDLYCGAGSYCGDVRGFLPDEYVFAVTGLGDVRGKWNSEISVGWNNATFTPDFLLMQYSGILTELDVSEKLNVIFSRLLRIPKVHDQKEKNAIESAIQSILDGKVTAVTSDNIHDIRELVGRGYSADDNFLDLTSVRDVDHLQYLTQYRENVLKRFFQMYGITCQTSGKVAQQNNDEIHANDDVSMTLFLQRYKYRKKLAEDMNKKFGLNVSVKISDAWQDSYDEIIKEETAKINASDESESDTDDKEVDSESGS